MVPKSSLILALRTPVVCPHKVQAKGTLWQILCELELVGSISQLIKYIEKVAFCVLEEYKEFLFTQHGHWRTCCFSESFSLWSVLLLQRYPSPSFSSIFCMYKDTLCKGPLNMQTFLVSWFPINNSCGFSFWFTEVHRNRLKGRF